MNITQAKMFHTDQLDLRDNSKMYHRDVLVFSVRKKCDQISQSCQVKEETQR